VQERLIELGEEGLEERLQMAGESPANPPHRLAKLIQVCRAIQVLLRLFAASSQWPQRHAVWVLLMTATLSSALPQDCILSQGKAALVLEVSRRGSMESVEQLAQRAKRYATAGADAIALRTDAEYTAEGLKDLWSVCRAVKVPVMAWDWHLHPLQVRRPSRRRGLALCTWLALPGRCARFSLGVGVLGMCWLDEGTGQTMSVREVRAPFLEHHLSGRRGSWGVSGGELGPSLEARCPTEWHACGARCICG
jgi:hypothetical protein